MQKDIEAQLRRALLQQRLVGDHHQRLALSGQLQAEIGADAGGFGCGDGERVPHHFTAVRYSMNARSRNWRSQSWNASSDLKVRMALRARWRFCSTLTSVLRRSSTWIRCQPKPDCTSPLTCPTFRASIAPSNSGTV